ncbi:hypothetical protein GCM10009616_01080 [Microlunatus lacustris]
MSGPPRSPSEEQPASVDTRARSPWLRALPRSTGWDVLLWVAALGTTLVLQWPWLVLYLDIRYTFGAFQVAGQAGLADSDVFIHRPLAHKLLMSWLDRSVTGPTILRERLAVGVALVFSAIVGAALARALRGWLPPVSATAVGLATFTALAWAPAVTMLQPEWIATLLAAAAVSSALAGDPRRPASWHSPLVLAAAFLLALATLQKYTTVTTAVVALGVVFLLHRRRAIWVAGWTVVVTAALFGSSLLASHEWQWFLEVPRLNPPGDIAWPSMWRSAWNLALLNPVLLFAPAFVILGFRATRRREWLIGPALALAVVLAGVIVQRGFFPYHYAALPVLAAGLVTVAGALWWRRAGTVPHPALVALVWMVVAGWLVRRPFPWRVDHVEWVVAGAACAMVVSIGLAVGQALSRRDREARSSTRSPRIVLTFLVLVAVGSFSAWPHAPYALYLTHVNRSSEVDKRDRAIESGQAIREAAGGASAVYLARQDVPYFVGLPTRCRYPTATFLYRSARTTDPLSLRSVQENLACLRDRDARFLVLQPAMLDRSRAVQVVRDTVATEFDCDDPTLRTGDLLLCPRR